MARAWTVCRAPLVLWCALCLRAVLSAEVRADLRADDVTEEANFTTTTTITTIITKTTTAAAAQEAYARGGARGTPPPPAPGFALKLRVVDSLSRQPLSAASVHIYINFTHSVSARTQEDGEALFNVPHQTRAVISAVATKDRYVSAILPVTTHRMPVFSSVTLPLLGLNRGNMWLFNDSVLIVSKSTGAFGGEPLVHFPSSGLTLSGDTALATVTAFMNSPSLWAAEGAPLHTMGIISTSTGLSCVELRPVASASVQLLSSSDSALNVSGPVHMRLPLCESCGLQEGEHVPAWSLNHSTGGWMRRGLGTVESVDGRLMWTFTAPHLGHWMAAPLSPSTGLRLEDQLDFILRHGSFLMILLGSTLAVAVCLLLGLLCRPRPSHKDPKLRRPVVNPLLSVRDQSTSTCEDQVLSDRQYHVISNPHTEPHPDPALAVTLSCPDAQPEDEAHALGNGFFFYNQPVAVLHAPAFLQIDEQQWSKSASLPRMGAADARESFTDAAKADRAKETPKEDAKMTETNSRAHGGFPESVSEPGTLGQTAAAAAAQGPRAWFVTLEGKPAAEIRYNVAEEQRRRREAESRDTSLDSGVDLSEGNQNRREVKLERNATFVKRSSRGSEEVQGTAERGKRSGRGSEEVQQRE